MHGMEMFESHLNKLIGHRLEGHRAEDERLVHSVVPSNKWFKIKFEIYLEDILFHY